MAVRYKICKAVCSGVAAAVLLAGASTSVWAEAGDQDQPMHIESDALRYESQQQRSIFSGNVVVTKGSIVMRGARLVVTQGEGGLQSAVMEAADGARAFFRQKRDGVDEYTEGEAQTIEYKGQDDTVHLIGNAEMRRLAGSQVQDKLTGATIVYDNVSEVYTVKSTGGVPAQTPGGRVRATLIPSGSAPAGQNDAAKPSLGSSGKLAPAGSAR